MKSEFVIQSSALTDNLSYFTVKLRVFFFYDIYFIFIKCTSCTVYFILF